MKKIEKEEMLMIEAGAEPMLITGIISSIITFIVGALHGFSNPKKCNN